MFTGGLGRLELIDGHIRHYSKYKPSKIKKIIKFETKSIQTLLAVVSVENKYITDDRNRHNQVAKVSTA
jgi:hypothetical protein